MSAPPPNFPFHVVQAPGEEAVDSARSMAETVVEALPRLGVALATLLVGWLVSRLLRLALHRLWRRNRTPSFAQVMSKMVGWIVLFLVGLAASAIAFPSVRPVDLLAGLGFFSVAVGFAFQDILENTLSGVLLLFRQPFRSGDQIHVTEHEGTVEGITIRETRLRTFDGQLILIPNRDVYKNAVRVMTAYPYRLGVFTVGVGMDSDLETARSVISNAVARIPGVSASPPVEALVRELTGSAVSIDVRFWAAPRHHERLVVIDAAIDVVRRSLADAGVEMPTEIVTVRGVDTLPCQR